MLKVEPLPGCFGAVVSGTALNPGVISDSDFADIEAAFYAYSVLVFSNQKLSEREHIEFSRRFGDLETTMVNDPSGGGGFVNHIGNVDSNGDIIPPSDPAMIYNTGNQLWHTDSSYKTIPAKASLLYAEIVPSAGGETEFACMRSAWDALSPSEQASIEDLVVEHDIAYSRSTIDPNMVDSEFRSEVPGARQTMVRTLPETGKKTFYLGAHAARIAGWSDDKSRELIDRLNKLAVEDRFTYLHKWSPGDLVMWDNRCCLHRGHVYDGATERRVMRRTTVAGLGSTLEFG